MQNEYETVASVSVNNTYLSVKVSAGMPARVANYAALTGESESHL